MNAARNQDTRTLVVYLLTTAGSLIWLSGIFLAPYLASRHSAINILIYAVYSPLCHQISGRSFSCFGHPLAVCGRCLGIYVGFFLGLGIYPIRRGFSEIFVPKTGIFIAMSAPIVIDTAANFLHIWMSPNWFRLVIGFVWGIILPFYFITGLADLARQIGKKRPKAHGQ